MEATLATPRVIRVVNPATLEVVGEAPVSDVHGVARAVEAARVAQRAWAKLPIRERAEAVRRIGDVILREREAIARLATEEMGKPFPEALASEVFPALDAVKFVTGKGRRVLDPPRKRLSNLLVIDRTSRIVREPVGVVGIVSPWNYPFSIPATQVIFALMAGNAVVLKPASATPLVALKLRDIVHAAGIPPDLFHVLPGSGATVGKAMAEARFDHVIFTGGEPAGRAVAAACAARGVGCTLELGGSDPAIVLEDADLDLAANGIVWARFANAGQTCAAVKRVYVVDAVADTFVRLVTEKVAKLRVGNGLRPDVDVGPLVDAAAVSQMEAFVADATAKGGRVLVGGARTAGSRGHFFSPTVLADVPPSARVLAEEVFGPILPIVRVRTEAEAVESANRTPFGLSASVWSRDRRRARRVAAAIQAGTVGINDHAYTYAIAETPWGGVKASGTGHTHGEAGLHALTVPKHVNEAPSPRLWPNLWWYPYAPRDLATLNAGLPFLYGRGVRRLLAGPRILVGILRKKLL